MKMKKITLWQTITAVLAVLLIASIYTDGFKFDGSTTTSTAGTGELSIVVLNDERCAECDTTNLVAQLTTVFPDAEIVELDYNDEQGKELYDDADVQLLPAVLFTDNVKEQDGYAQIQTYLTEAGDYLSLRVGASFDPAAEICNNEIDDNGDGKIDCDDADCEGSMLCRDEIVKKLDVFVMSQCPYGTIALDAMEEVLENFEGNIDFNVHFIANENPDGSFNALHGQPEVDENIRELCAIKNYPDDYEYMDYIWCRNKNIQSADWEPCAVEAFGTGSKIKECFEGDEGKQLLSDDIKIANQLEIGASPTWLANNQVKFSGIDAETVKQNYCNANPGLEGCDETLSSTTAVSGSC